MSIEPITRLQRFLRVLADSSADMPEPLRNLEKCCCYACGHLDTRPELHTTLEKLIASVRDKSIVPPKPNTRLEKYVAAMAGVWDDELPYPITREDKILFEAASGEDVTLSGNPLILENCIGGKALKALHVYGKSTQDGTPTPDAPVPIVSAGDGGSVAAKVTGKNLLNIPDGSWTTRGVTVTAKDGLISISGTATSSGYAWSNITPFITSGVAILSSSITSPRVKLVSETWGVILSLGTADKMSDTATRIVFLVTQGQTYNLTGVKVQLELGTTATAYSPYREQTITLQTPNGLPGIPAKSGGNYTDENGQQWVCDEVDLERGVRVENTRIVDATDLRIASTVDFQNTKRLTLVLPAKARGHTVKALCNRSTHNNSYSTDDTHFYADGNDIFLFIPISAENPVAGEYVFLYALADAIETPLTEAELAAYKALTTYAPTTVLQATDGAGLEATYKCNVRKAEKTINDLYAVLTAELEA